MFFMGMFLKDLFERIYWEFRTRLQWARHWLSYADIEQPACCGMASIRLSE